MRPIPEATNVEGFFPLPIAAPVTTGVHGIRTPKSQERSMAASANVELSAANNADVHLHYPAALKQGENGEVSLEIGQADLLKMIDEAKNDAMARLTINHNVLMTVSMKGYLTTDSTIDHTQVGNQNGQISTLPGYGVIKWMITPKSTGDHKIAWNLIALLRTEEYGTFEQAVRDGTEHVTVDFSWTFFFRQFREAKAIDAMFLLGGFLLKWVWDLFKKLFKPADRRAPVPNEQPPTT